MDAASVALTAVGIPIAIVGAFFGYRALFPPKRQIRLHSPGASPLMRTRISPTTGVEIRHNGQLLLNPHIMQVSMEVSGRHSIRSDDFDQKRPFELQFTRPIIADLSANVTVQYETQLNCLRIGPDLLTRGERFNFTFLLDGAPDDFVRYTHYLIDTRISEARSDPRRERYTSLAAIVVTSAGLAASLYSLDYNEPLTKLVIGCFVFLTSAVIGFHLGVRNKSEAGRFFNSAER